MTKKGTIIVAVALLLSNAMAGLDGTIINTALPSIISDLHGIEYMGWIVAVFLLGMAVATPLWSKLGERIGNKKVYQISTTLFALGSIFQALSGNIYVFLIARIFMGIGAGGMNTIPFIIYADLYEDLKQRAKIIGFATASFSIASIIGPLIGGWIVDTFSWHWVFYINVPIAFVSVVAMQIFFREKEKVVKTKPVDYLGAILLISGLILLLLGIQMMENQSIFLVGTLLVLGLILLGTLYKVEQKAVDAIIPNRLFKNKVLLVDFALFALLWGAFVAFNIYIPMWAQGLLGVSALVGGMTQIPGAFTNVAGSIVGPSIQFKSTKYRAILYGTISFMIAFGALLFAGVHTPLWFLLLVGAFEGFGLGLCFNVLQISVQNDAQSGDVPVATSFAYLLRILSQTFMSSIYGVILNNALKKGVASSNGQITISMLNKLGDAKMVGQLPKELLPQMRSIMFHGIHNIMVVAFVFLILALLFNLNMQFRGKK